MKQLILASGSPRRRVLMQCMGLDFSVIPSNFDEQLDDSRSPQEVAIELGLGKAKEVATLHPDSYVVGSDLIIVMDGKQLEKPHSESEAKQMLQLLSGRTHQAVVSVVLVCIKDSLFESNVDTVDITFRPIPEHVMDSYIATGDPYDKAGGYARQHPLISPYIESISGDPHAVTGLSTIQLRSLLQKHNIRVPNDEKMTIRLFAKSTPEDQRILI